MSVFHTGPLAGSEASWSLADIGWSTARAAEAASIDPEGVPGRVIRADRGRSLVAIEHRVLSVATDLAPAAPAVGDWVTLYPHAGEGRITAILRRETRFSRATALSADSAGSVEEQLMATTSTSRW